MAPGEEEIVEEVPPPVVERETQPAILPTILKMLVD